MDIKELKQMIKSSTAVLVLEEGNPSFVIIDYKSYKDMIGNKEENRNTEIHRHNPRTGERNIDSREMELLDKLNKEILTIKSQIEEEEKRQRGDSVSIDF